MGIAADGQTGAGMLLDWRGGRESREEGARAVQTWRPLRSRSPEILGEQSGQSRVWCPEEWGTRPPLLLRAVGRGAGWLLAG